MHTSLPPDFPRVTRGFAALLASLALSAPAAATYHLMQIELVIGGVNGDARAQAIQLRMRTDQQHILAPAQLVALDARGQNPVVLFDFASNVANDAGGARILVASEEFASYCAPALQPDFVMTNRIPESYLAAGSLVFQSDDGTIKVFRLSWGGAAYTGPTTGFNENDDNGDFGAPFPGPLPSSAIEALQFQGAFGDASTTNAANFALSAASVAVTNNAGASFSVVACNDPARDADGNGRCDDTVAATDDDPDGATDGAPPDPSVCGLCGPGAGLVSLLTMLTLVAARRSAVAGPARRRFVRQPVSSPPHESPARPQG